jgi:hypothetical protein
MGWILAAAIFGYAAWFTNLVLTSHFGRASHAPGVLAVGLCYATRLVTDFGPLDDDSRRRRASRLSWTALVVGGLMDVAIILAMFLPWQGLWR